MADLIYPGCCILQTQIVHKHSTPPPLFWKVKPFWKGFHVTLLCNLKCMGKCSNILDHLGLLVSTSWHAKAVVRISLFFGTCLATLSEETLNIKYLKREVERGKRVSYLSHLDLLNANTAMGSESCHYMALAWEKEHPFLFWHVIPQWQGAQIQPGIQNSVLQRCLWQCWAPRLSLFWHGTALPPTHAGIH